MSTHSFFRGSCSLVRAYWAGYEQTWRMLLVPREHVILHMPTEELAESALRGAQAALEHIREEHSEFLK